MTPSWTPMPDSFGWYLFTPKLEDWDLADMVQVTRIDSCGRVRFESSKQLPYMLKPDVITPNLGWWYGPFHIEQPRREKCDACGKMVYEWSDPEGGPGRVCKVCEKASAAP